MSKFVGFVVGAALVIVGLVTANPALVIQGGLLIVSNAVLLLTQPKQPARQASEMTIQLGEQPRSMFVGEGFTAGSLVDGFNWGGKYGTDWEGLVIRLADHKCFGLTGFYVNDEYVPYVGNGNYPQFDDHHFQLFFRADTTTEPLCDLILDNGPGWTSADIGESGCDVFVAYLADKPDAKHPAWPGGRPRFGFVIKGAYCYDPRLDDTVTGGSGPHRIDDPDTWEWSDNAAICRYRWVRGVYANDDSSSQANLLVGRGLTAEEAPPENIIAAANLCDEALDECLPYEQPPSDIGYTASFAPSPDGSTLIRWVNNDIEWFNVLARSSIAFDSSAGDVLVGTIINMAVTNDGDVYFMGTDGSADRWLYKTPLGGSTTQYASDAANGFNGPTRAFNLADGTLKVFSAEPGGGYLDFGIHNSDQTYAARDFALSIDRESIFGVFQEDGASDQFSVVDLTGSLGDSGPLTALTSRSDVSTARITMNSEGNLFVTMSGDFYVIDPTTWTILDSGSQAWGTDELPLTPGRSSFWAGYSEYSLIDASFIQSVDPLDWVSENSYSSKYYDPINNAIWTNVQFESHVTIRFFTGNLYRVAGPIYSNQDFIEVEGMFAAATGGTVVTRDGSVELNPGHAESVVFSFTDDDILSATAVKWNQGVLSEADPEWLNTVVARYVEPDQKWNDHAAPVVRSFADIVADGKPREVSLNLRLVRHQDQALHVAEINRRLGRLWGRAQVTLGPRFCEIEEGDWGTWTSARFGFTKTFRVEAYNIDEKWQNTLTLREINSSVYDITCDFDPDLSEHTPRTPPPDIGEPDDANWTLSAEVLTGANGNSIPALVLVGDASDDDSAEAIVVEYWLDDTILDPIANPDDIPWTLKGRFPPTTTRVEITGLQGGGTYYVAVSYIVSGIPGDRLVLGPETVADIDVGGQVGGIIDGLTTKAPVRVATTASGTLASSFENGDTIDGVTLATGDRILIKNQSTQSQNGIYVVAASGSPARSSDADTGAELVNAVVRVTEGTLNAGTQWRQTTPATITLGSSNIVWEPIGGGIFATAAEIRAGTVNSKPIAPDQLVLSAVPQTLTDAATTAWDMSLGYNAKWTIGGNRTLGTPTNPKEGLTYILEAIQDSTGTRLVTWPSAFDWGSVGTPTLSTASGKVDVVSLFCYDASTPKFRAVFSKAS